MHDGTGGEGSTEPKRSVVEAASPIVLTVSLNFLPLPFLFCFAIGATHFLTGFCRIMRRCCGTYIRKYEIIRHTGNPGSFLSQYDSIASTTVLDQGPVMSRFHTGTQGQFGYSFEYPTDFHISGQRGK